MDSSAIRANSPVYFLDIDGLEPAEQQRVCEILGVPMPAVDVTPMPVSTRQFEEPMGHVGPIEFGFTSTTVGPTDAGIPVGVPGPHMLPVPVAVVTANHMVAATMVSAGMCVVSIPGGLTTLPGIPLPGLHHQPTFVHPDFFRNQPPPNMALNPHVQEFVPGREYIMQGDGGKSDMATQPLHAPIYMPVPVPFVPVTYPDMPQLVPNGVVPGGIVVSQDSSVVETAWVKNDPTTAVQDAGPMGDCEDRAATDLQQPVINGSDQEHAVMSVNKNIPPATAASVSVKAALNKSDSQFDGTLSNTDAAKSIRFSGAGMYHNSTQSHRSSLGPASSADKSDSGKAPATVSVNTKVSVSSPSKGPTVPHNTVKTASQATDSSSQLGSNVDSVSEPSVAQPSRTISSHKAMTLQTSTQNTVQCNPTAAPTTPTDSPQITSPAGFPALSTSEGKPPACLVNGLASTEDASVKDTAARSSSVAGMAAKPTENSQALASTAAPAMSWANLFKGSNASSKPSVVIYKEDTEAEKQTSPSLAAPLQTQPTPTAEVVSVSEDSVAKTLGEFMSKIGVTHTSVALQPRGLVNRGNWCYVNATLQALVACPPFYHLFKKLGDLPISRSASSTPILDSLVRFTSEFSKFDRHAGNPKRGKHVELVPGAVFEPDYIYKMLQLSKASSSFKLGHQEDAEEFLSYVLDGLHDEMLSAIKHAAGDENGTSQVNGFAGSPDAMLAHNDVDVNEEDCEEEDWQQVGPRNKGAFTRTASTIQNTPIADIFVGFIRSGIMQAAAKERATLQPFFTLQLDIQEEKVVSVREALEHFVCKESIQGYTCSKTGEEVEVMKRTTMEKLPPVLILHLKCFVYDQAGGCQKLLKNVKFEVDLPITKDLLSPAAKMKLQSAQRNYKLFAVVFHHGKKATGGHYTTDVFHPGTNGWVHMDDSRILQVLEQDVLNYHPPKMPYLLYYRRRDTTASVGNNS